MRPCSPACVIGLAQINSRNFSAGLDVSHTDSLRLSASDAQTSRPVCHSVSSSTRRVLSSGSACRTERPETPLQVKEKKQNRNAGRPEVSFSAGGCESFARVRGSAGCGASPGAVEVCTADVPAGAGVHRSHFQEGPCRSPVYVPPRRATFFERGGLGFRQVHTKAHLLTSNPPLPHARRPELRRGDPPLNSPYDVLCSPPLHVLSRPSLATTPRQASPRFTDEESRDLTSETRGLGCS